MTSTSIGILHVRSFQGQSVGGERDRPGYRPTAGRACAKKLGSILLPRRPAMPPCKRGNRAAATVDRYDKGHAAGSPKIA